MTRHPLLVVGLDGADFRVLNALIARGKLPVIGRLMREGICAPLLSTLPPATLPAWTSFLTAAEPNTHGVVDMLVRDRHDYALRPAGGHRRRLPTFLYRVSQSGLRVASLGIPGTYPPEALNGVAIAGFDAPGAARPKPDAFWPPELASRVHALGGWRYATFNEHGRNNPRRAVAALLADLDRKERVVESIYTSESWDLFCVHLQAPDTACHHLWHTFDEASPRYLGPALANALPSIFARLDTFIGRLLALAPKGGRVLLVSDHGMGGASTRRLYLNRLLAQLGLTVFHSGTTARRLVSRLLQETLGLLPAGVLGAAARALSGGSFSAALRFARGSAVDLRASAAFSDELDYAPSIWIHERDTFPLGHVPPPAVGRLLDAIGAALLSLSDPDTGEPLIAAVHGRGPVAASGPLTPHLVIEPAWPQGYRPSFVASPGPGPVLDTVPPRQYGAPRGAGMPGVHRREGIFVAAGAGLAAGALPAFGIAQAGASVFTLLGLPLPADLEARPPAGLTYTLTAAPAPQASPAAPYTPEEEAQILSRLRAMGYVD